MSNRQCGAMKRARAVNSIVHMVINIKNTYILQII